MFPDVVILAGGLGKRLQSVTGTTQKVLAVIGGKPFLEILIDYIASQGGTRFILCVGHGGDEVENYFKNRYHDREIIFSMEEFPLGTGGAIKQGCALVKTDTFLAANGDCFCVIDYKKMIGQHKKNKAKATLAVTLAPDASDYGSIAVNPKGEIIAFKEKLTVGVAPKSAPPSVLINTGTYCFDRDIFSLVHTPSQFSIEHDFFPYLAGKGFYAFEVENKFIDIGTPARYQWAQEHWREIK